MIAYQAFDLGLDYSADLFQLLAGAAQFLSSLAAIVIGAVAILQIKRSGGRQKGIGFAIAGIAFQAILYIFFICSGLVIWYMINIWE
jgi:hypothetical protein